MSVFFFLHKVLTGGADPISIQDVVSPNRLSCCSVKHWSHHLVKGLVGVTSQNTFGIFINQTSTKT